MLYISEDVTDFWNGQGVGVSEKARVGRRSRNDY